MGKVIIIARVGTEKNIMGYRIMDMFSGSIKDVPTKSMIAVMRSDPDIVINAELVTSGIVGTNGDLRRYPLVGPGEKYSELTKMFKKPVTIMYKIEDIGFKITDCYGRAIKRSKADAVKIAETFGITNGKVISKDNKKFISAISGEYPTIKCDTINNKSNKNKKTDDMGEIEKFYVYMTKECAKDSAIINKERFVARCIDSQNYANNAIDKIKDYIEKEVNKNGADINLCRYFMGNLGGELYGVRLKKVKTAIRVTNKELPTTSGPDFSCAEAVPADKLIDINLTASNKLGHENDYVLHIDRIIFGEKEDIGIRDTIIFVNNPKVGRYTNTQDVYFSNTYYKGKKKVNKRRLEKYLEFEKNYNK